MNSRFFTFNSPSTFWVTRVFFIRGLGLAYMIAYLVFIFQFEGLIGEKGLMPASLYLQALSRHFGGVWEAFWQIPTVFYVGDSDMVLLGVAIVGLGIAGCMVLGLCNGVMVLVNWILYMSIVHVGQTFYGFGWEMMMLEVTFLAVFMLPFWRLGLFSKHAAPPTLVFWLIRWMLFRVMFGAGMIKLRGDGSWMDLTALYYHFETQPIPSPMSYYYHHLPKGVLRVGVIINHVVELIVPFFYFCGRRLPLIAGGITVLFQLMLISSGNLSWLNGLTILLCFSCFDDTFLLRFCSHKTRLKVNTLRADTLPSRPRYQLVILISLALLVGGLSLQPTLNLFQSNQRMNSSFDRLHLVNTYGAFGHVGKVRHEVIISGTYDATVDHNTRWFEFEFKAKPGNIYRRPPFLALYHYRLDWQIWFAAMSDYRSHPWLVQLVYKLLSEEPACLNLLAENPFSKGPPQFIKVDLYRYEFTSSRAVTRAWWKREWVRVYLPPLSRADFKGHYK